MRRVVLLTLSLTALPVMAAAQSSAGSTAVEKARSSALVATHYFYWYRWPDEHFKAGRPGREGHFHHFVQEESVSYTDPDWHRGEFEEMARCGIDIALPVYWGAPGAYDRGGTRFSVAGLAPMAQALQALEAEAKKTVRLGLFYDTSTLRNDVRGVQPPDGKADLTTPAGKSLFCQTVIEYFERIPKHFWARIDGRVLVVLYTSHFAKAYDATLGPALRAAFTARFPGEGVYLVADSTWGAIGQDRTTSWGAALSGPKIFPGVVQIGPGYDDSPVPGRRTPSRPREGGNFYRWSWRQAILTKPQLVLLETWNEMHEGSEICATKETGRTYLELTREWIERLRRGEPGSSIPLRHREPKRRPDRTWGREAAGLTSVFADYTGVSPTRMGLREIPWEDSSHTIARRSLRPRGKLRGHTYLYFQISDSYRFDVDQRFQVVVDAEPIDGHPLVLDFDSRDATATLAGAYTTAKSQTQRGSGQARRMVFDLPGARFANRQNGGADFRLRVRDVRTAIRRIEVRPANQ